MATAIDALTSPTLKHLREEWWDDEFTEFLAETLKPRPGNRILDVGCGEGLAEVAIARLQISQVRLVGIDYVLSKVVAARQETASHNQRVQFAAADACRLPFRDGVFDALFSVAVLQHVNDLESAVSELSRVTAPRGRVVAVEPDNSARYGFSSTPAGRRAFELSRSFFSALSGPQPDGRTSAIGPNLPRLFSERGLETIEVRLFPVSQTLLGPQDGSVWQSRRSFVERALAGASDAARWLGRDYLDTLATYEAEAQKAGSSFVEIQNTMLFATVGQKLD